jgi:riboflavin kinase/FMN adenylyltransferase
MLTTDIISFMNGIYTFKGIVNHGKKRGKQLGYPTMNVACDNTVQEGIYVSNVVIDLVTYNAVTFIGAAKTFDEQIFQSETYILEFDKDIYGKEVEITLLKKLRDNMKFESEDALREQMQIDVEETRKFFAEHKA